MPEVSLNATDAAELVEMLDLIVGWLARDHAALQRSLLNFVGTDGYDVDSLRADLARFAFLLGGDAEPLFGPESH
ncbi:hypothetical protein [Haloactinopolyspora sp.]|uniref:hypothetical protein n=1 Tax=Haloactinopolyspora sp. TaxID=1966353 RepID=UPI00260AB2F0|nr:hypothetical protein [Haloactinopolyspora sp.]